MNEIKNFARDISVGLQILLEKIIKNKDEEIK